MAKISIIITAFLIILITVWTKADDRGWLTAQTYVLIIPRRSVDESARPLYECRFNRKFDCHWYAKTRRVNISDSAYSWNKGNGLGTNDCSIVGKSNNTGWLDPIGGLTLCWGSLDGPLEVELGGSIELECDGNRNLGCHWDRDYHRVAIDGRYSFSNEDNCSMRINDIQRIDITLWRCFRLDFIHERNGNSKFLLTMKTLPSTRDLKPTEGPRQDPTNVTTTVAVRELTTVHSYESTTNVPTSQSTSEPVIKATLATPIDNSTLKSSETTNFITNTEAVTANLNDQDTSVVTDKFSVNSTLQSDENKTNLPMTLSTSEPVTNATTGTSIDNSTLKSSESTNSTTISSTTDVSMNLNAKDTSVVTKKSPVHSKGKSSSPLSTNQLSPIAVFAVVILGVFSSMTVTTGVI